MHGPVGRLENLDLGVLVVVLDREAVIGHAVEIGGGVVLAVGYPQLHHKAAGDTLEKLEGQPARTHEVFGNAIE